MRNGFEAVRFQSAGDSECVHADAGQRPAVDVHGIHVARRHDLGDLFHQAIDRDSLGRINLDRDGKLPGLNLAP